MKTILKKYAIVSAAILFAGITAGCTGDFEEYNTNPHSPTPEQMKGDNAATASLIQASLQALCYTGENTGQELEQFVGGDYGGMMAPVHAWGNADYNGYSTYNPGPSVYGATFSLIMKDIYTSYFQIRDITGSSGLVYHWMNIIRVAGSLRVSDTYGPIPYSKITGNDYTVAYDSMETLYDAMFADLDAAIEYITSVITSGDIVESLVDADVIYKGDFRKWVKFANTLKLRMAMRISNVKPALAKEKAEEAAQHAVGTMTEAGDRAENPDNDKSENPLHRIAYTWNDGEVRISANITSYMSGYNDPRLPKYATQEGGRYAGVRHGINRLVLGDRMKTVGYSNLVIDYNQPMLIMSAAEAWFLKAEGALNGWDMGSGNTAQSCYNKGIEVSMQEHGVSIGSYLTSSTRPAAYTDPSGSYSTSAPSTVTVPFSSSSSDKELNRERIMVQKWLANFPNGWETWADIRRTGYPKFMPVVSNTGTGDGVTNTRGMRRLRYPQDEYNNNKANVEAAVGLLGGPDTFGTDLWWAKKN